MAFLHHLLWTLCPACFCGQPHPFCRVHGNHLWLHHIKNIISSIGFLHKILDLPFDRESFRLRLSLQSLKRKLARAPLQALPISVDHLKKMYMYVNLDDDEGLAIWASILVGFFGLLRKKNLVPEDLKDIATFKILTVRKIKLDINRGVTLILVNFAKNNQVGQKQLVIPLIRNNCQALDPIYHLNLLFSRSAAPQDSPAFSFRKNGRPKKKTMYTYLEIKRKVTLLFP